MKKNIFQFIFILLLLAVGYFRISVGNRRPLSKTDFALGTFITIDIRDHNKNNNAIIDSAFSLIKHYEQIFSSSIDTSEIEKINRSDSLVFHISDELESLLRKSKKISSITQGAFDVTTGKIIRKYNFVDSLLPTPEEINATLAYVDHENFEVSKKKLILNKRGITIELGGIAKGYIVDKVVEFLRNSGIKRAAINAGGDLYLIGSPANDEKWKIGIRHPRSAGEIFGNISLSKKAVVTSGDYEQYFLKDGKRIHHILDPATGLPADKSISVTTIADKVCTADAFCTAIFILGPEAGIQLANSIQNIDALIIYKEKTSIDDQPSQEKITYKTSQNFNQYNLEIKSEINAINQ